MDNPGEAKKNKSGIVVSIYCSYIQLSVKVCTPWGQKEDIECVEFHISLFITTNWYLKKKKKSGKKYQTFELRSFYLPLRVGQTLVHWIVYWGQMPKAERSSWQEEHHFCDWNTHKTSYKEEHCRILNKFAPMRKKKQL